MKKIIPIVSIIGFSTLLTGCGGTMSNTKNELFMNNINEFKRHVEDYTNNQSIKNTQIALNKYKLTLATPNDATFVDNENVILENNQDTTNQDVFDTPQNIKDELDNLETEYDTTEDTLMPNEELSTDIEQNQIEENLQDQDKTETEITNKEEIEQISTLYSLSADIDDSCDEFCELKTRLTNAIIETQNLIQKVQTEQIELTPEQRMLITEQSKQLKELGRQLSFATTDLSVNLSDLNQLMRDGNGNLDALSLKYLVVLDNLVNGNEMLANGLNSLNLINQMFYMNSNMPGNNQGRILYGFRRNNEPPVVKDYIIDENGQMIENNQNQEQTELVNQNEETLADESNKNIDTYNQPLLKSNIDTFGNTRNNIDTFFNTAWLDNNFMYGNGGYPYGMGMHNGYYPYVQNRQNFNNFANTTESVNNDNNTQYTPKQTKKKFKLKKNVDTYKDENTPTVSAKITTIKNNISNFFNKFSKKEKKVENPVYKYE